jgi:putative aldouronate transport system permease protein
MHLPEKFPKQVYGDERGFLVMTTANRIRPSSFDRIFNIIIQIIAILLLLVFAIPILNVIAASFSSPSALMSGKVWIWPVEFSLESYEMMFSIEQIWVGYANSIFYTVVGTFINLLFTVLAAYPLSKKDLMGRSFIMGLFTFTMFFSGGLVPSYMLIRSLGMLNTRWALIIPGALSVYNMIIARTFFSSTIPPELFDAADIDGSNDLKTIFYLVLPLSGPILAVLGLYYAVGHWNSYFNALVYLTDHYKYPLQLVLRDYLLNSKMLEEIINTSGGLGSAAVADMMAKKEVLKYSLIVVAALPMIIIYPFIQRFFIQGVMVGSLKG